VFFYFILSHADSLFIVAIMRGLEKGISMLKKKNVWHIHLADTNSFQIDGQLNIFLLFEGNPSS
jgi:hypothetical protein